MTVNPISIVRRSLLVWAISGICSVSAQTVDSQPQPPVHKENIVVTGQWKPVALEDSDRSVNSYALTDAPLLFGSLTNVLDLDSSVFVESRGANGIQADFSIRGGTFGQTLLLLNGLRLNDTQSGHYNSDLPVPMDAISSVEVLRGSGSTLYGSDAVTGVVNILTQPTTNDDPLEIRVRGGAGNFGSNEQSGFADGILGPFSERISFERDFSTGFMDDRDYRNLSFGSDSWLKTKLGLSRLFLGYDDRPFGANQFYGPYNSWERTKTWLLDFSQDLGSRTQFSMAYRRHTDIFELLRTDPSYYTNYHQNYLWDGALRRHDPVTRDSQVYYGVEFVDSHVDSNNLGVHTRDQGAVYAAYDIRVLKHASVSVGGREEFYNSGEHVFAPNVTAGYWLSGKVKARGAVSRAYRLPTFTDLYYHDPANIGNPNLKAEEAWNYEGGVDWYPREHLQFTATVFERREENDIDYVRANAGSIWMATNFARVNFTGFEGEMVVSVRHNQKARVEFTSMTGAAGALNGLQSEYAFNYPTQQAVLSWERASAHGWMGVVRSGVANQYQRSAYMVLDASAAWNRSWLHPYVRTTNLTNTSYEPVYGVAMPGRAYMAGLEICVVCRGK